MSDMYFDVSTFDFDSLTDVVVEGGEKPAEKPASKPAGKTTPAKELEPTRKLSEELGPDGGRVDDASDLIDYSGLNDDDIEGEETEQEEYEVDDSEVEDSEIEVTDEDGEEVDFEDYQITLPSGDDVTLSQLVKGYRDSSALDEAVAQFNAEREEFATKSSDVGKLLELARLEADRVIDDYKDFDWSTYRENDPAGYVENREFLDRYKERRKEIVAAQEKIESERVFAEQADLQRRAKEAGEILTRDLPGWGPDLYKQLMDYAVANGADREAVENSVDPAMFKILHKALQFEKGKQVVKAKVKKIGNGAPVKVLKPGSKPAPKESSTDPKKQALLEKMKKEGLSKRDHLSLFDHLVD